MSNRFWRSVYAHVYTGRDNRLLESPGRSGLEQTRDESNDAVFSDLGKRQYFLSLNRNISALCYVVAYWQPEFPVS